MDPLVAKGMLKGQADPLNSAFHLSYNMILNLMRVEGVSPDYMLERSFYQFQNADSIPAMEQRLGELETEHGAMVVENEGFYRRVLEHPGPIGDLSGRLSQGHPPSLLRSPLYQVGRLVRLRDGETDYGWCAVVNLHKKQLRTLKSKEENSGPGGKLIAPRRPSLSRGRPGLL